MPVVRISGLLAIAAGVGASLLTRPPTIRLTPVAGPVGPEEVGP